jgi:uncharacterized membrane protein
VQVPIECAYNPWTQFEEFPRFMEGGEDVRQLDDRWLHWVAEFGGERHDHEWAWRRWPPSCGSRTRAGR